MRCFRCGEEVPEGSKFCIFCGEKMGREGETRLPSGTMTMGGGMEASPRDVAHKDSCSAQDVRRGPCWNEGVGRSHAADENESSTERIFLPPEADAIIDKGAEAEVGAEKTELAGAAGSGKPESERTVAISPVPSSPLPSGPSRVTLRTLVCPECYAENPVFNRFCQECGNPLPSLPVAGEARQHDVHALGGGGQKTSVLAPTPALGPEVMGTEAAGKPAGKTQRGRWASTFGPADVLCGLSLILGGLALTPLFRWKRGLEISVFSHQGPYLPGSSGLFGDAKALGGPGILPYQGWEFFTAGSVIALALGLAFMFLMIRVGRGPMYLLSGCISLLPAAYVVFQGLLPLRQQGINIRPPLGAEQILFGGPDNLGAGPAFWLSIGVGVLLLLAGFVAPPRGWGRLFTFLVFFPLMILAAFFCAACYNWNLFIGGEASQGPVGLGGLSKYMSAWWS